MNSTSRKVQTETKTIYPIIQNKKSIRNKLIDNNGSQTMKSLKNKTIFNYFNNNPKKCKQNDQTKAKSLKVIHQENKCTKGQHPRIKK